MASGIKDKVAILGMGCSKFGERWDKEADDLMVEAYEEALADAGIETKQINAAWLSTAIEDQHVGKCHRSTRPSRTQALCPPNPMAFESATSTSARRASFGT